MGIYHLKNEEELFANIQELVDYVVMAGICPSAEIYRDGDSMGEYVVDYVVE